MDIARLGESMERRLMMFTPPIAGFRVEEKRSHLTVDDGLLDDLRVGLRALDASVRPPNCVGRQCSAVISIAGHSAYSASKAAVDGLSNSVREEHMTQGTGLSILHPGPVRTRIIRPAS